uniref:Probable serine/threonine-protein kinase DDB_G0280133 n=1 Tax=Dermatophagoides pteronyssinus TaxID=6956 RepID=A0A6P6Y7X8_DERPT|nr:probable serine/threonine-protein kinase DDB_G0280133 [Dermatophagoides pteronyssinus]
MGCLCCKCCCPSQQPKQTEGEQYHGGDNNDYGGDYNDYIIDENGELVYIGEGFDDQQQQQQQQEQEQQEQEEEEKQHQEEKHQKEEKQQESSKIVVDISRIPTIDVTPVLSCKPDGSDVEKIIKHIGYRLEKEIGKGGYGTVYLAKDLKKHRKVACKVMKISNNRRDQLLIKKELFFLRTIRHKNIIRVYKHFILQSSKESHVYIFMQYAEKNDLWHLVRKKLDTGMKEKHARKMFKQISSAIYYLHQRNVAHRDIKLENILLDNHYNCLITDFGLSIIVMQKDNRAVNAPNYCGTLPYMAPEIHLFIITRIIFDVFQADVWALGVVLYCMTNQGRFPFSIEQDIMIQQQLCGQYEFTNSMSFKPDERFQNLIAQMFQPNPVIRIRMVDVVYHPWLLDLPIEQNSLYDQQQQQQQQQKQQPQKELEAAAEKIAKQNLKTTMMNKGKLLQKQMPTNAMIMMTKKKRKIRKKLKVKIKMKKFQRTPIMKMLHQPKSPHIHQQQSPSSPQHVIPILVKGKTMYATKNQQQQYLQFMQQQQKQSPNQSSISTSTISSDTSNTSNTSNTSDSD